MVAGYRVAMEAGVRKRVLTVYDNDARGLEKFVKLRLGVYCNCAFRHFETVCDRLNLSLEILFEKDGAGEPERGWIHASPSKAGSRYTYLQGHIAISGPSITSHNCLPALFASGSMERPLHSSRTDVCSV